jgi:hypothetical protein
LTKEQIEAWRDWWHEPHLHTRPEGKEFAVLCDMALSARSEIASREYFVPLSQSTSSPVSASAAKGETPRSDAVAKDPACLIYLARQLERELADALALAEQNAQIAEAMGKRAVVSATGDTEFCVETFVLVRQLQRHMEARLEDDGLDTARRRCRVFLERFARIGIQAALRHRPQPR